MLCSAKTTLTLISDRTGYSYLCNWFILHRGPIKRISSTQEYCNTSTPPGVLLGILGWGVPPSSILNVIFHTRFQTWPLKSIPIFRPDLLEIMSSLLRLEQQQKKTSKKCILISHISLSFLLIWNGNDKYVHTLPWLPRKPYPISDQNGAKTKPFGATHTYMACIDSRDVKGKCIKKKWCIKNHDNGGRIFRIWSTPVGLSGRIILN